MNKQSIAIIGGGGAGTTAAWTLSKIHQVTLFESEAQLGGHAYTETVSVDGQKAHIDMGVEYFNERLSPNLCAMLAHFNIDTYVAPLSIKAVFEGKDNYWSNISNGGVLRRKLSNDLDKFHFDMAHVLNSGDEKYKKMSIAEFLDEKGYSDEFKYQALLPLMTTYSGCNAPSLEYNLMYPAISFNMNLLSFFSPGYWRKAKGGINGYITNIAEQLGSKVKTNCRVHKVKKHDNKVEVVYDDDKSEMFDQVIFATHADIALSLIDNSLQIHKDILGKFEYVKVHSVLHHDKEILSEQYGEEYCEFSMPASFNLDEGRHEYGNLTRINNNLIPYQNIQTPLLVTFDPKKPVNKEAVRVEKHWKLPKLRPQDFFQKTQIYHIQGIDNMWFCGTDTSLTGHEGAIVSGLVIADRLGAKYPFENNNLAKIQFNVIKEIMGVKTLREKAMSLLTDALFQFAKRFSLHKEQSHKFIKDLLL